VSIWVAAHVLLETSTGCTKTSCSQGAQGAPQGAPAANAPRPAGGGPMGGMNVAGQFERILFDDLIPYIESNYRVIPDQAHRAMAGLSMGGMQTRSIVIANPDRFSHIGMFSSGTFTPSEISDLASFKKNVKLVFMSFGGKEGGAARIPAAAEEWNKEGIKGVLMFLLKLLMNGIHGEGVYTSLHLYYLNSSNYEENNYFDFSSISGINWKS
jgi:hypothetical protein